jgi:nitrogen fixation/metabolism regulation signal transduction histidine kinase
MVSSFTAGVVLRVCLIVAGAAGFGWSLTHAGYMMTGTLSAVIAVIATVSLVSFAHGTNRDIAQLIGALRHQDLGLGFTQGFADAGHESLRRELSGLMAQLRAQAETTTADNQFLLHLVDQVPIPLMALQPDGRIELLNKAARRLLSLHKGNALAALAGYGHDFVDAIANLPPGTSAAVELDLDGARQRAVVTVTEIISEGQPERLVALLNIQSELDLVQLTAWRDLVRVLTHEIMNSMTPITSLARTAADLAGQVANPGNPQSIDLRDAVETVARRSDGVMRFVQSYRQVSRVPAPERQTILLASRLTEIERLLRSQWPAQGLRLTHEVEPAELQVDVDPALFDQVLINLLRNAADAAMNYSAAPEVFVRARASRIGRVVIDIDDNGAGVPADQRNEVFLPFYTTKADGTGVGLSVVRQIMLAHGGSVSVSESAMGGARFTLVI